MEIGLTEVVGSSQRLDGSRPAVDEFDEESERTVVGTREYRTPDGAREPVCGGRERRVVDGRQRLVRAVRLLTGVGVADQTRLTRPFDEQESPVVVVGDGLHTLGLGGDEQTAVGQRYRKSLSSRLSSPGACGNTPSSGDSISILSGG
ncbi:MAG: hypothetical protein J07HB67_00544 [halophilic archaeon J07HB67]|nr:MAG: hypothetical protein J07HB67_00544 [halophilic archaeon J07HB67]